MEIASIRHKALRRFAENGIAKGLIEPERLARMLAFLSLAASFDEFSVPPNYGFHALSGDRKGDFAMTVTRNWRLTFTKVDERTVANLDLEDYHGT
jgi:proteic killer suppression protein